MKRLTILPAVLVTVAVVVGLFLPPAGLAVGQSQCPTCCDPPVVVDENVTIDFNSVLNFGDAPTYTGEPDLIPYFSWDTPPETFGLGPWHNINQAWRWKAIFNLGCKKLVLTNNATITIVRYYYGKRPTSDDPSPGIDILGTCEMDMQPGTSIIIQSHNDLAGDIFIKFDGNINIDGTVRNAVSGTGGLPGDITIASCCGDVIISEEGIVQTIGQDPGGSDINILTCCECHKGNILIQGLVDASYKAAHASTINIVSFDGSVTIDGNNFFGIEAGTQRRITSGVTIRSRRDPLPGTINIQAKGDITVLGNTVLQWQYPNIGAVGIKTASNSSRGGAINVCSLEGKIIASDRAFDNANRFNTNATIDLMAKDNIELSATGRTNSVHYLPPHPAGVDPLLMAVVSTQAGGDGTGGTNTLRSYSGGISIGPNAQVLANWTGRPGSNGTNLLTSCTGVTNNGVVDPTAGPDPGLCDPEAPAALFCCCVGFGVECECQPCGSDCCWWCSKGTVLEEVRENMGNRCIVPDIFVDVTLPHTPVDVSKIGTGEPATGSLQAAIDYIYANGDPSPIATPGEIFIGVNSTPCEDTPECDCPKSRPLAGATPFGTENVVITNPWPDTRLNVFGCSVTIHADNSSEPAIWIKGSAGKVTVMDIHVQGSTVAGYLIGGDNPGDENADLVRVKNSRSFGGSGIGYHIIDDDVEISGSQEISGHDIGILVAGSNVTLRTNNDIVNNLIGIKITGDNNVSNGNDVGKNGKPNGIGILVEGKGNTLEGDNVIYNTTDGIVIAGSGTSLADGNFVTDEDTQYNGDDGIVVSGNYNTLDRNHQVKFNTGDGIEVSGNNNRLNENTAEDNTGHGIVVSGNNNNLVKNEAIDNGGNGIYVTGDNNTLDENTAEDNTLNGIKADSADGATGNNLVDNEGNDNLLQGIRACGQTDGTGNSGEDNGIFPEVIFVCSSNPPKFFVADDSDVQVYKYDASGVILDRFDLDGANEAANGVATVGSATDVYVLDKDDKQVYKYNTSGTLLATSKVLKEAGGGGLSSPTGVAIDGDDLWIVDDGKTQLYRYSLDNAFSGCGSINALQQIDLTGGNGSAEGLAIDATYLYVLDDGDKMFYRYPRSGGAESASKTLREVGSGSLSAPSGATLDGTSLFVVDRSKKKVYEYTLSSLSFGSTTTVNATSEFSLHLENGDARGI